MTDKPDPSAPNPVRVAQAKCAVCGEPVVARFRPFCSARCADVDLGRWLKGTYRVETDERPLDGEVPETDAEEP